MKTETEEYKLIYAINDLITQLKQDRRRDYPATQTKSPASLIKEVMTRLNKVEMENETPRFVHHAGDVMTYLKEMPMNHYLPMTIQEQVEEVYQEEVALDYEDRLTEIFCSLIEWDSAGEASQKTIMKIRQMIKEEGLGEDVYATCRLFLSAENVLETHQTLKKKLVDLNLPIGIVNKILKSFYVNVGNLSGKKRLCSCCGREWSRAHLEKSPVCHYYYQAKDGWHEPIEKTFNGDLSVLRLDEKVIESIVLPNLGEIRLRDRLLALKQVEVIMYPGCDDYDLKVIVGNKVFLIDLKDFRTASGLVQHIKHDAYGLSKLTEPNHYNVPVEHVFLVVPKHRLHVSETSYLESAKEGLASVRVQVISEDEFVQHVKNIIEH